MRALHNSMTQTLQADATLSLSLQKLSNTIHKSDALLISSYMFTFTGRT